MRMGGCGVGDMWVDGCWEGGEGRRVDGEWMGVVGFLGGSVKRLGEWEWEFGRRSGMYQGSEVEGIWIEKSFKKKWMGTGYR